MDRFLLDTRHYRLALTAICCSAQSMAAMMGCKSELRCWTALHKSAEVVLCLRACQGVQGIQDVWEGGRIFAPFTHLLRRWILDVAIAPIIITYTRDAKFSILYQGTEILSVVAMW